MNKKYLILIGVALVIMIAAVFTVSIKKSVVTAPTTDQTGVAKRDKLSENKVVLVSRENNVFRIRVGFKSDGSPKSILRYYVSLYQTNNEGEIIPTSPIGIAKYDDVVVLKKDNPVDEREIVYFAPSYLKGKYVIMVKSTNETGVIKNAMNLGAFDLDGNGKNFLEIFPGSCRFSVAGESGDKKYTVIQGVDVKSNEDLIATCSIANHFSQAIEVKPEIVNYRKMNVYPQRTVEQESRPTETVMLNPDEMREVSFSVPKALVPQAYDAELSFSDESGHKVSNSAFLHYVLAGNSSSVEELSLDKNDYAAGEKAVAKMIYYGPVDGFENSRLGGTKIEKVTLKIDLRNSSGESCLSGPQSFDIDPSDRKSDRTAVLDVKKRCQDPSVSMVVVGANGNVLEDEAFLHAK